VSKNRKVMYKKGKEKVVKRRARKPFSCDECGCLIGIGEEYYDDHISYVQRRRSNGHGYIRWIRHIVCESCWKGPKLKA